MPSKDEILDTLRVVLVDEFKLRGEQIVPTAYLVEDLDLDSIDAINLAIRLEEENGLDMGEEELRALRTVQDVVDVVHRKLEASAGAAS